MKKFLVLSALILTGAIFSASAIEKTDYKYEYKESKLSYHSVQVYKVLDHRDAYIVMYAKGHRDVGTISVPKKWYANAATADSKLSFRALPKGMYPYMTVFKRDGQFDRVMLTLPVSRDNPVWGVADSTHKVEDADKETFDIVY